MGPAPLEQSVATTSRALTLNDITFAWQMDDLEAAELAAPIINELKALADPAGRDAAGIPYRGGEVLREVMEGAPIAELAALYVTLFRQAAGTVALDPVIFACGTVSSNEAS